LEEFFVTKLGLRNEGQIQYKRFED